MDNFFLNILDYCSGVDGNQVVDIADGVYHIYQLSKCLLQELMEHSTWAQVRDLAHRDLHRNWRQEISWHWLLEFLRVGL